MLFLKGDRGRVYGGWIRGRCENDTGGDEEGEIKCKINEKIKKVR